MQIKLWIPLALVCGISFSNCSNNSATKESGDNKDETTHINLTEEQASQIFSLPIHCLEVEYPNKLGQVLGSSADLKSPKQLRPIFYGCFDWHSSVHGYWSIVELLQKYPDLDKEGKVRAILNQHITPENVAIELAFFNDKNNTSFERTYGWAWLFKLQESLSNWDDADAQKWKADLQPLVDLLVVRYKEYLPKLVYPIRAGQHDNSAFGLSLSLDYAKTVGDKDFEAILKEHGKRLFVNDINCNLAYEPSGYDFLSPCLEEAYLMSKVLDTAPYRVWLKKFMPNLLDTDFAISPAVVKDRTDGKLVHLDGLNYSRGACLYGIAKVLPELSHLKKIANQHIAFSLPNLSAQDDYMGSHWLGTFALYAIAHAQQ
ncbi:DUF2891 domain-containing protein [Sphingobacterium yanglingense]|uniref:DUF2891 family protein n=1 Tax=Sphingobacterium yanglingense TaxID=1437280 RepID=A0A4R6WFT0_9SPHI|nr:DUF2891 domain-containing protein [Sphingobacterium yanglingense]TDQ77182.1 Protein of unknown function (DUF2891) [Sphingobacterium yanglingense]